MTHEEIRRFYDRRGAQALLNEPQRCGSQSVPQFLAEPYKHVDEAIRAGRCAGKSTFLDVCCGRGAYAVYAAMLGYEVVGVDLSALSIRAAERLAETNGVRDHCQFLVGEALTTAHAERFDVIFVGNSLYYLDLGAAIDFAHWNLNPDGLFICVETNGNNLAMNLYRRLRARVRRDRDLATLTRLLGTQEVDQLLGAFCSCEIKYYGCLTMAGWLTWRIPVVGRWYHALAARLDQVLLNRRGRHRIAFNFVFCGSHDPCRVRHEQADQRV